MEVFHHDHNQLTKGKISKVFNDHDILSNVGDTSPVFTTWYGIETEISSIAHCCLTQWQDGRLKDGPANLKG